MKFSKKLTAAAAIVAAGFATNVAAETATDTIEVYAGLAPALELTCTNVHFGVWRVPTGDRGGATKIQLNAGTFDAATNAFPTLAPTASDNADRVALSQNSAFNAPQVGTCIATGSAASGTASAKFTAEVAEIASGSVAPITDANQYAFGTIGVPNATSPSMNYSLTLSERAPTIDGSGKAMFAIEGELSIPNNITVSQHGGYKSADNAHTVEFDDTPPVG